MANSIVKTENLRFSYEAEGGLSPVVLDGVDLEIEEGSFVAVLGHNGSGKSTTINLISGFLTPDSGIIDVRDQSIAGLAAADVAERGVARTFQNGRV